MKGTILILNVFILLASITMAYPVFADVLWLQHQNLKSLDGKHDLTSIHSAITENGRNTAASFRATLVGSGFRELVIQFERPLGIESITEITNHYVNGISRSIEALSPPSGSNSWSQWFMTGMRSGRGKTVEEAFVDLKLKDFGLTYEQWKREALELRRSLLMQTEQQSKASWIDVLEASRRLGRDLPSLHCGSITMNPKPLTSDF